MEFHAAQIHSGNGEPWHSLRRPDRQQILIDLCDAIVSIPPKALYLFGVAVHKASFDREDPVEKAFHELCGHLDAFIEQANLELEKGGKSKNRGLMVLDCSRYAGRLDKLLLEYRRKGGTKFGRVRNFADAPTFAKSETTRLLQAADVATYAVFRYYERNDTLLFNRLIGRFHETQGKIHGLMHLRAAWRECACPGCLSRKLSI